MVGKLAVVGVASAPGGSAVQVGGTGVCPVGSSGVFVAVGGGVTVGAEAIRVGKSAGPKRSPRTPGWPWAPTP